MFYLSLLVGVGVHYFQTFGSMPPFGVKMCKLKCETTVGCDRIWFQVKDFGCCVQDGRINLSGCFNNTHGDDDVMEVLNQFTHGLDCDKGFRIINTRTHTSLCEQTRAETICRKSDFKTRNYTALIVDAFDDREFKVVRCLLALSLVDVNMTKLTKGRTPVMLAASYGNKALFDHIIRLHCDLSTLDSLGRNVMHMACKGGNLHIVKTLVEDKLMDIDVKGNSGQTPIMVAAYFDRVDTCAYLIERGCNLVDADSKNCTVIDYACRNDAVNIARKLIDVYRVPIESRSIGGRTPFLVSAYCGSSRVLDLLVARNCNVFAIDDRGNNGLHLAADRGHSKLVEILLQTRKFDVNARGQRGLTPIAMSVIQGEAATFSVLLNNGADPLLKDNNGFNPLHLAASRGHSKLVEILLQTRKFDVNARGQRGLTPIAISALQGEAATFSVLLNNGADPLLKDNNGFNPLHLAVSRGHSKLVEILLQTRKFDVNARGQRGVSPIAISALQGEAATFSVLLNNGADPLLKDNNGLNALHHATFNGKEDIVKQIISKVPEILDTLDNNKRTSVMLAAAKGEFNIFKLLVEKGAAIKGSDVGGNDIFKMACEGGDNQIKQMLTKMREKKVACD